MNRFRKIPPAVSHTCGHDRESQIHGHDGVVGWQGFFRSWTLTEKGDCGGKSISVEPAPGREGVAGLHAGKRTELEIQAGQGERSRSTSCCPCEYSLWIEKSERTYYKMSGILKVKGVWI